MKDKIVITAKYKVKRSTTLLPFLLEKINTSRNNIKHLLSNKQVLVMVIKLVSLTFP